MQRVSTAKNPSDRRRSQLEFWRPELSRGKHACGLLWRIVLRAGQGETGGNPGCCVVAVGRDCGNHDGRRHSASGRSTRNAGGNLTSLPVLVEGCLEEADHGH